MLVSHNVFPDKKTRVEYEKKSTNNSNESVSLMFIKEDIR